MKTSLPLFKKIIALALGIILFPTFALAQDLNSIDEQINQYQNQIQEAQNQSNTLQGEISSFNQNIADVQNQIADTQNQIDEKEKSIVNLTAEIEAKQKELDNQKKILNDSLVFLYETGDTPMIEVLLSSQSISSALDQMEYISWVEKQIEDTVNKITQAKKVIEADKKKQEEEKTALVELEQQQNGKLIALSEQKAAKDELLAYTQSSEQIYQEKLGSLEQQRAYLISLYNIQFNAGSGTGGYPWGGGCSDQADSWGYYVGQCTSYVAWKRSTIGKPIARAIGNAGEWTGANAGYPESGVPQAGDVMVMPASLVGGVGHVAYVESVNANGTVNISQYNWADANHPPCTYSEMTLPMAFVSASSFIH